MRLLYGKRRDYLVSLIQRYLGPEFIHEYDEAAGLHLVLKLPNSCDDVAIAATALERGVKVRPFTVLHAVTCTCRTWAADGLCLCK